MCNRRHVLVFQQRCFFFFYYFFFFFCFILITLEPFLFRSPPLHNAVASTLYPVSAREAWILESGDFHA